MVCFYDLGVVPKKKDRVYTAEIKSSTVRKTGSCPTREYGETLDSTLPIEQDCTNSVAYIDFDKATSEVEIIYSPN